MLPKYTIPVLLILQSSGCSITSFETQCPPLPRYTGAEQNQAVVELTEVFTEDVRIASPDGKSVRIAKKGERVVGTMIRRIVNDDGRIRAQCRALNKEAKL